MRFCAAPLDRASALERRNKDLANSPNARFLVVPRTSKFQATLDFEWNSQEIEKKKCDIRDALGQASIRIDMHRYRHPRCIRARSWPLRMGTCSGWRDSNWKTLRFTLLSWQIWDAVRTCQDYQRHIKALRILEASGFDMKNCRIMLIVGRSGKQENSIEGDLISCRVYLVYLALSWSVWSSCSSSSMAHNIWLTLILLDRLEAFPGKMENNRRYWMEYLQFSFGKQFCTVLQRFTDIGDGAKSWGRHDLPRPTCGATGLSQLIESGDVEKLPRGSCGKWIH